ncbi:glycosyltransferase family 2 protein [Picosynechococcus sp. PCC 8807]|uniref:glycosyltransferase family 2 protein n=1 Tax=Picosynechococcus sp. PCC 8807 TaxID=195248 RepID=UPI000810755F|nr:glycosyltransferase family 2 protein [Picosynechococcus sp. PCC 8807]ANV91266.1 hypothetical protein AWQ24_11850 [Picosynechococcus sp. PCC 8807]
MIESISIIIPCYNCGYRIVKTFQKIEESIVFFQKSFNSSEPVEIEVIIVDDCSTDKTPDILSLLHSTGEYQLKIISHPHNRGASVARNTGVKASIGEILFFCDGDDFFEAEHILFCYSILNANLEKKSIVEVQAPSYHWTVSVPEKRIGYVATGVKLDPEIHSSWKQILANSLTINICVHRACHEFINGFSEEPIFKIMGGSEDCLYREMLDHFFESGRFYDVETVEYKRYPGNAIDKQMPRVSLPYGEYVGELPHEQEFDNIWFKEKLRTINQDVLMRLEKKREAYNTLFPQVFKMSDH